MGSSFKVVGIDPGDTGAFVVRDQYGIDITNFKKTNGLADVALDIRDRLSRHFWKGIYLENVHAFPGQGSSSMFQFGVNVGKIQGILLATGYDDWIPVMPTMWQKELGLAGPYPTKTLRKQAHLKKALELFPEHKNEINIHNADAVLIAEYGYRKEKQKEEYYGI